LIGRLQAEIETAMVWLISVKFKAGPKHLACAKDLTILSMAGRYKQPVQYGRRVRLQKLGIGEPFLTWIQHISKEENVLISGTREESAVADSAEPKQ
jgi:hypothetical protein